MLVIFDSNYVGYVSAFALSQGLTYRGGRTEVIFGFLNKIMTIYGLFEPEQIAFCWDARENKRKDIYPGYKLKDSTWTDEERESFGIVHKQFDEVREVVLPALGFANVFHQSGYEGDDLIARLVIGHISDDNDLPIVVANDEDLFQLLDFCRMFNAVTKMTTTKRDFKQLYGLDPLRWAEVKAIAGCKSDKVPSVNKGIGTKTAIKYLKGNLAGKAKITIDGAADTITRNRQLVTLPFPGTRRTKLAQNNLSVEKFRYIIEEYGLESMNNSKTLGAWERMSRKLNKGEYR